MTLNDSFREMLAMIELEMRRLRHDRTEIYTRSIQPILWLGVFGTVMSRINAIPTGGLPYIDYITPGVLLQSTIFVSVFYGLTIVWERETGILKSFLSPCFQICNRHRPIYCFRCKSCGPSPDNISSSYSAWSQVHCQPALSPCCISGIIPDFRRICCISIFVASIMKTRERFMGLGQALIMPLFFASNALYPIDMTVDAMRGLMISGDVSNWQLT